MQGFVIVSCKINDCHKTRNDGHEARNGIYERWTGRTKKWINKRGPNEVKNDMSNVETGFKVPLEEIDNTRIVFRNIEL